MKKSLLFLGLVWVVACGSATPSQGNSTIEDSLSKKNEATVPEDGSSEKAPTTESVAGRWENTSCGERNYKRTIRLESDGKLYAVDEVQPCPPGAQCIWSGIINWNGTWSVIGEFIELDVKPPEGGKLPLFLPEKFAFVSKTPPVIGESISDLVCPYRRIND